MCTEKPGPRCSNHASKKKERKWETLVENRKKYPADSLEVKEAERGYYEACEEYKSTPDGLEELKNSNDDTYSKYARIRDYQVEALNEIRNGRQEKISTLVTSMQTFYDEDEVASVLAAARRQEENSSENDESLNKEEATNQYFSMLNNYEEELKSSEQLTQKQKKLLTELRRMKPPKEQVSIDTYKNLLSHLSSSQIALKKELQKISILQDVSMKVSQAYHDAYRQEYKDKYASLPAKQQPNPPENWVEGDYTTTGFINDPTTRMAPADAASMYATFRLRSDTEAIPDYLKNSRIIATANVDNKENKVAVVLYNNKGKEVDRIVSSTQTSLHSVAEKLRGKIIVLDNDQPSRLWLSELNKQSPLNSSVISTNELSSKHLNLPDNSLATLCQATSTPYVKSLEGKATSVLESYFGSRKRVQAKWASKSPRKNASPLDNLPLTSRWG